MQDSQPLSQLGMIYQGQLLAHGNLVDILDPRPACGSELQRERDGSSFLPVSPMSHQAICRVLVEEGFQGEKSKNARQCLSVIHLLGS